MNSILFALFNKIPEDAFTEKYHLLHEAALKAGSQFKIQEVVVKAIAHQYTDTATVASLSDQYAVNCNCFIITLINRYY